MGARQTSLVVGLVAAALLCGGCLDIFPVVFLSFGFSVGDLTCVSPSYELNAGDTIPIGNPCDPTGKWAQGDVFEISADDVDVESDQSVDPPTRFIHVAANARSQEFDAHFEYAVRPVGTVSVLVGDADMHLIIHNPHDLVVRATATPSTVLPGGSSQLHADVQVGSGSYAYEWFCDDSTVHGNSADISVVVLGTLHCTVKVIDTLTGGVGNDTVTVTVVIAGLTITTPSLPSGTVGVGYQQTLTASPSPSTLEWTVDSGTPPNGLNLQTQNTGAGFLTGTPISAGTFNFRVRASDTQNPAAFATHDYSIQINNPVPGLDSLNPSTAPAGTNGLPLTINGSGFVEGATVIFGSSGPLVPSSITPTQIQVTIPASALLNVGLVDVTVTNPGPGGGSSQPLAFQITAPVIAGLIEPIDLDPAGNPASGDLLAVAVGESGRFVAMSYEGGTTLASPATVRGDVFLRDTCAAGTCGSPTTRLVSAIDGSMPPREGNNSVAWRGFVQSNIGNGMVVFTPTTLSGDGNLVGFGSLATNLVSPATTRPQAFLGYTCANAASSCNARTVLASKTNAGAEPNDASLMAALAPDGQHVVFYSRASNILDSPVVPSPAGELYLRDTCVDDSDPQSQIAGCTPRSTQVSQGKPTTLFLSDVASSRSGRLVVFISDGQTGYDFPGGTNPFELYLKDTCGKPNNAVTGCSESLTLLSRNVAGDPAAPFTDTFGPSISDDGRFVVFTSDGLGAGGGRGGKHVYLRDTCRSSEFAGLIDNCDPDTPEKLVMIAMPPPLPPLTTDDPRDMWTSRHSISADGRYVIFRVTTATTTAIGSAVYVYDTCRTTTGPVPGCQDQPAKLVSVDGQGNVLQSPGGPGQDDVAISRDGHYAVFFYQDLILQDMFGNPLRRVGLAATGF
jgi:hypothetical protein